MMFSTRVSSIWGLTNILLITSSHCNDFWLEISWYSHIVDRKHFFIQTYFFQKFCLNVPHWMNAWHFLPFPSALTFFLYFADLSIKAFFFSLLHSEQTQLYVQLSAPQTEWMDSYSGQVLFIPSLSCHCVTVIILSAWAMCFYLTFTSPELQC